MSKEKYACWSPDMGEDADDARLFATYDDKSAAEEYVERSYHDEPFEQEMTVMVRGPFGKVTHWAVVPEPTISFLSRQLPLTGEP